MGLLKKVIKPIYPYLFRLKLLIWRLKNKRSFLIIWNRGLGDIPLGLFGLNLRIKEMIPQVNITYLTREDLKHGFEFLSDCNVTVDEEMKRGIPYVIPSDLLNQYDVIIENANPTDWLFDQLGNIQPKMSLGKAFKPASKSKIAIHVQSETGQFYGYEKNWPKVSFQALIQKMNAQGIVPILIGLKKDDAFLSLQVEDLRGELNLKQVIEMILGECHTLIAPDSGILSMIYYFDNPIDLKVISLWSDPNQGILKHNVVSPNPLLKHTPLIEKELKNLAVERVLKVL